MVVGPCGSPAASRAQRVAAWLRKRSELQRGGSLRCAVTRMYRRCYGGFCDPSLYVVRAPFAASARDLTPVFLVGLLDFFKYYNNLILKRCSANLIDN